MKLLLICHGETDEAAPGLGDTGHGDPPLTARGRKQAEALALELHAYLAAAPPVEAVYASPLRPASETAEALAAALALPSPLAEPALSTLTPEVLPSGGAVEALTALQERAWDLVEELRRRHDDQTSLLLVTHELPIRALVCRALGMSLNDARRFALDPASITTIEFRIQGQRERTLLANLNETCHLEALLP